MPICPILKWYMYKIKTRGGKDREIVFPINSVIEGTLTIEKDGGARIDTDGLEKHQTFSTCII